MKKILSLVVICSALSACGTDVKKTLGFEKTVPDEFAVVERAPLTVPPEFNLVPPVDGGTVTAMPATQTKELVLGSQVSSPSTISRSEQLLIQKAGPVNSNIRQQLAVERDVVEEPKTTIEKLGLKGDKKEAGKALNPVEEAKKLQQKGVPTTPLKSEPVKQ